MKVYIHSISYPPRSTNGAVRYNHALAKFLQENGCHVRVLIDQISEPYEYDGIEVFNFAHHMKLMRWADVVLTEPGRFRLVQSHPNVIVMQHQMLPSNWDYSRAKIIYCAGHVERKCRYKSKKDMVLYPTSRYEGVKLPKGKPVNMTLFNCNANKGGPVLPVLARMIPESQFVGVLGDYGQQYKYPNKNIKYVPNEDDVLQHYANSDVVLLPSAAEGFPTVALEAMSLGIPVAAFPIDAMKEMLGSSLPIAKKSSAPHLVNLIREISADRKSYAKLFKERYEQLSDVRANQLRYLLEFIMP